MQYQKYYGIIQSGKDVEIMVIKHFSVSANSTKNIDITTDFGLATGAYKIAVSSGKAGYSPPSDAKKSTRKRSTKK